MQTYTQKETSTCIAGKAGTGDVWNEVQLLRVLGEDNLKRRSRLVYPFARAWLGLRSGSIGREKNTKCQIKLSFYWIHRTFDIVLNSRPLCNHFEVCYSFECVHTRLPYVEEFDEMKQGSQTNRMRITISCLELVMSFWFILATAVGSKFASMKICANTK